MNRLELKDEFDEDFVSWAKSVMVYAKKSCIKTPPLKRSSMELILKLAVSYNSTFRLL